MKGTVYGSIRRWVSLLLGLALLAALLPGVCALAEEENGTPGEETLFSRAWLCSDPYGYGTDVAVLVITNDPGRRTLSREETEAGFRYIPFDSKAGMYAPGDGEPAGDRAQIAVFSEKQRTYTVHLNAPGKYILSGAVYYLLDSGEPALREVRAELDDAVAACRKAKEAQTAKAVHDWICARVSPVLPEEGAEGLEAACGDPMNALLKGYACREAYALLNGMLLNTAGIRCLTVSGTAGEEAATWSLFKQDGQWRWTDAAMDDLMDKKSGKYFALEDKAIWKDHALGAEDRTFTEKMIRGTAIDAVLDGTLPTSLLKEYKEWENNFDFLVWDGPAWVVGEEATVSFRLYSNRQEKYRGVKPEEILAENMRYFPFLEEDGYYYNESAVIREDMKRKPEIPAFSELVTVEEAAEDLSSFTLTFHVPGEYLFFEYFNTPFYLISPEQEAPAAMAAEMDAAVEKAKSLPTEKKTAKSLFDWIRRKVKYNYTACYWADNMDKVTDWDMQASADAINALLCGKCVCNGYAGIYSTLMQQAGIRQFFLSGVILPSNEGHAWNINKLDGVWSQTDATWNLFDQGMAQMSQKREYLHEKILKGFFFQSAFELLAEESVRPLDLLPRYMKVLPLQAEGYGFPDISDRIRGAEIQAETIPDDDRKGLTLQLEKASGVRLYRVDEAKEGKAARFHLLKTNEKPVKEFRINVSPDETLMVELLQSPNGILTRPVLSQCMYIRDGKLSETCWRYLMLLDRKKYPDMTENSTIRYEYDAELRPLSVKWQLVDKEYSIYDIQVLFDAAGKVEHYTVDIDAYPSKYKWEGTAETPLTALGLKKVQEPAKADPLKWEAIWFE